MTNHLNGVCQKCKPKGMESKDIIEGINLIAKFMGYYVKEYSDTSSEGNGNTTYLYSKNGITTDELWYNSSWDALIPVILKCWDEQPTNGEMSYIFNDISIFKPIEVSFERVVTFVKYIK
jgi:hypothetical protein